MIVTNVNNNPHNLITQNNDRNKENKHIKPVHFKNPWFISNIIKAYVYEQSHVQMKDLQ